MLIDLAKMAKIHKFSLANSLLDSPMATWLTLTGTLDTWQIVYLSNKDPCPKISIHKSTLMSHRQHGQ